MRATKIKLIMGKAMNEGCPFKLLRKWNMAAKKIAGGQKRRPHQRCIEECGLHQWIKRLGRYWNRMASSWWTERMGLCLINLETTKKKEKNYKLQEFMGYLNRKKRRTTEMSMYIGRKQNTIKNHIYCVIKQHQDNVRRKESATSCATAVLYEGWRSEWENTLVLARPRTFWRSILAE